MSKFLTGRGGVLKDNKILQKALRSAAEKFVSELRLEIPISRENRGPVGRTGGGHLRDSLRIREKGLSVEIYSTMSNMMPFLKGTTKRYKIRPKFKKALAWPNAKYLAKSGKLQERKQRNKRLGLGAVGSDTQFAMEVDHPGVKPFEPFERLKAKVPGLVRDELKKLV